MNLLYHQFMQERSDSLLLLENTLKQKGLGVCFRSNSFHSGVAERALGIFPTSELALVYNSNHQVSEYLCPDHLPQNCLIALDLPDMAIAKCYPRSIYFHFNLTPEKEIYFIDRR